MKNLLNVSAGILTAACLTMGSASADTKIGMITTLSGGGAGLGIDVRDDLCLPLNNLAEATSRLLLKMTSVNQMWL